jgi:hypothetical protein
MILANITTYLGQCGDAEHYYCTFMKVEEAFPPKKYQGAPIGDGKDELKRTLTSEGEIAALNKKHGRHSYWKGRKITGFNSIEHIHKELKKRFGNKHTIVTYYEEDIFSEMLYLKDGVNLGSAAFGEVWSQLPYSCYKHLLPPVEKIKIKCEDCGTEHEFSKMHNERNWSEGRILIEFAKGSRFPKCPNCKDGGYLVWNVVL